MSELQLCYWNLRGFGEAIVLMLEYLGVKYNYKRYTVANQPEWFEKDKASFQGDFANLPYLMDGDTRITESMAIMRCLGRKFKNLYPVNEEEERKCDVAQGAVLDFRMIFTKLIYGDDYDKQKDAFIEGLPDTLSKFEKVLSKHTWLTGKSPRRIDTLISHNMFEFFNNFPEVDFG